jgi:Zn-dependent peptidase ImmA (M78 family)
MTRLRRYSRSEISTQAIDLLKDAGLYRLPVDVETLAAKCGISVNFVDLGDDYSGLLVIRGGSAFAHINAHHHPNRQRFSLAHEIGHFVLHAGGAVDVESAYVDRTMQLYQRRDRDSNRMEMEANFFAATLLMPEQLIRSKIFDEGYDLEDESDVARLAVVIKVSEQALSIRLTQMADLLAPITGPQFDNSNFAKA